eukprot:CAMPEP_0195307894 /NCGR_PEP_ID=MMETSP0707-20130614/37945_1 /TAXON_ID=33640 /ORGANISM="Asterionellopsis glacialis, Strain CCMP134" /LENGTH=679 /DNA_ID=CAMNT_0040372147 /DNA_START=176 /DNA_END=2216 /DNA_ORIENTATION=-
MEDETEDSPKKHERTTKAPKIPNRNRNQNQKSLPKAAVSRKIFKLNFNDNVKNRLHKNTKLQEHQPQEKSSRLETNHSHPSSPPQPKIMGNYRYDPQRKAYFPKHADDPNTHNNMQSSITDKSAHDHHKKKQSDGRSWIYPYSTTTTTTIPYLLHITETSPFTIRRARLRSFCAARRFFDQLSIIPSSTRHNGAWHTMLDPYTTNNWENPDDLTCKTRLSPYSPTFDIAPGVDSEKMPAMLTIVEGGAIVRPQVPLGTGNSPTNTSNPAAAATTRSSCRYTSTNDITDSTNHHEVEVVKFPTEKEFANDNYMWGALASTKSNPHETQFYLLHNTVPILVPLPYPANDFSLQLDPGNNDDGASLVFAPRFAPRSKSRDSSRLLGPFWYSFETNTFSRYNLQKFPQSDVLCIEHHQQASSTKSTLLCGHRNGQISIVDRRSRITSGILGTDSSSSWLSSKKKGNKRNNSVGSTTAAATFGSTTKILTTPGESNNVLCKGSLSGSCRLYDIRKLGTTTKSRGNGSYCSSMVWDMAVPSDLLCPTGLSSSCCSGLAVDPTCTIVISPFVNTHKDPCLGVWSLSTGEFVSSRSVVPPSSSSSNNNNNNNNRGLGVPYCELSSTVTNAYEMSVSREYCNTTRSSDMFGLWFKCRSVVPNAPVALGSIHHVVMPGGDSTLFARNEE